MSKAVLISIRPKWCDLIARGKKTIEVRKTRPKLETPFKCYIYQTLPKSGDWNDRDGRVIGEFVCDRIESTNCFSGWVCPEKNNIIKRFLDGSCLSEQEIVDYADGRAVCGWHISDLMIYDMPKNLGEFEVRKDYGRWITWEKVSRPPQSWCYVEEM